MNFREKLERAQEANRSLLCVGLDPQPELMPLRDVAEFGRGIIEATSDLVCAYKPNLAFYEALGLDKKDRRMEPFIVTLEPATVKTSKNSAHEGEEFIFVLEGEMEVILGDHTDVLYPGDSIYYDSAIPHRVQCHQEKVTRILAVLYAAGK